MTIIYYCPWVDVSDRPDCRLRGHVYRCDLIWSLCWSVSVSVPPLQYKYHILHTNTERSHSSCSQILILKLIYHILLLLQHRIYIGKTFFHHWIPWLDTLSNEGIPWRQPTTGDSWYMSPLDSWRKNPSLDTSIGYKTVEKQQLDRSIGYLIGYIDARYVNWIPLLDSSVVRHRDAIPPPAVIWPSCHLIFPPKVSHGGIQWPNAHVSNWGTSWRYPMVETEVSNEKLCRIFLHYLGPLRGPMDISHQGIWCRYPMKVSHCKTSLSHWCIQSMYRITTRLNTQPNRTFMGYFDAIPHAIHQCDTSMR